MSVWDEYPPDYRSREVDLLIKAAGAGESVAVVGLSGSGKSNLLGFIANRLSNAPPLRFVLVDCNRIQSAAPEGFYHLLTVTLQRIIGFTVPDGDDLQSLELALGNALVGENRLCLLLDRFDALTEQRFFTYLAGNLRALRDEYKYRLSYVVATRRPFDPHNELAELFFGRTVWLGPLERSDALWSARRDMQRLGKQAWDEQILDHLLALSGGYPALLRAACEACADGAAPTLEGLSAHPAVQRRLSEFWIDKPQSEELLRAGLIDIPLLQSGCEFARTGATVVEGSFDTTALTAKEKLLLDYFIAHPGDVCTKDDLVQAVWPEDVIFEQGVRDESLAQLVRRLRVKIEPDPASPSHILTSPGRGYIFRP